MKHYIKDNFRELVHWFLLIFAAHYLFSVLIYSITIRGMFIQMTTMDQLYTRAAILLLGYSVLSIFALCLFYTYLSVRKPEYTNRLKEDMKSESFVFKSYFKDNYLKDNIYRASLFTLFQLPYTVFYALFGYNYEVSIIIDSFYRIDAGIYLATKFFPLGIFAVFAIVFLLLFAAQYIFMRSKYLTILEGAPEGFYEHLTKKRR